MDSAFQDSPTIGRTQILHYSPNSPLQTPVSSASSRYVPGALSACLSSVLLLCPGRLFVVHVRAFVCMAFVLCFVLVASCCGPIRLRLGNALFPVPTPLHNHTANRSEGF